MNPAKAKPRWPLWVRLLLSPLLLACDPGGDTFFSHMPTGSSESPGREESLGDFLSGHWQLPIPHQGSVPNWSAAEVALQPETCGLCHPAQFDEWRSSLHAGAFSPGLAGQLIEGDFATPGQVRGCQECHAPLSEQMPHTAGGEANPHFDPQLRSHGITCAACHVRKQQRFGPPRREGIEPAVEPIPHGGFSAAQEFEDSEFCAVCHQFFDDPGINGKPVQNTYAEWQASPQAAEGRTCQSCHMPDRSHTWLGIHDAEMVKSAVDIAFEADPSSPRTWRLRLRNRDVGHAFPTYVTPRVVLAVWQEDNGGEIAGTREQFEIGRKIDFEAQQEIFDTRVPPGEHVELLYRRPLVEGSVVLVAQVRVLPDDFYRGAYEELLTMYSDPEALERIGEALRRARNSVYVLAELRRDV